MSDPASLKLFDGYKKYVVSLQLFKEPSSFYERGLYVKCKPVVFRDSLCVPSF